MASIAKLKGWLGRGGFGAAEALVASWFETRGGAALLTMRVSDLILRRREAPSRRMQSRCARPGMTEEEVYCGLESGAGFASLYRSIEESS
jgi:hypothetical protein